MSGRLRVKSVNGDWARFNTLTVNGALSGGVNTPGKVYYVDGTNGSDLYNGTSWATAKATIQAAVTAADAYGIVYVAPKAMVAGSTDPNSYTENVIIPATHECLSIIGVGNRTQGGLPQMKPAGTVASAAITVRAPGCKILGMGVNGNATAGTPLNVGVLLDDDAATKTAFGTEIAFCHFKNCAGSTPTDASTGGAITFNNTGAGGAWQVWIHDNNFYKCYCDVCAMPGVTTLQDIIIENNVMSGPAASVNCNLYLIGSAGINGLVLNNNMFPCTPSAGSTPLVIKATGCIGIMCNNTFATTGVTYAASGTGALIPTTLLMASNYQADAVTQIVR